MAFPTLSRLPRAVDKTPLDNTLSSDTEAGIEITRKRWTKKRYQFDVTYSLLGATDKGTFFAFYDTVECHTIFAWTHPTESVTYNVRFKTPVKKAESTVYGASVPLSFTLVST